jgi:hypothetical protein
MPGSLQTEVFNPASPENTAPRARALIQDHTFRLLTRAINNFYHATVPDLVYIEESDEINVTNTEPKANALMVVAFVADIQGQAQLRQHNFSRIEAAHESILREHKSQKRPYISRSFLKMIEEPNDKDNPYLQMRSLRRNQKGLRIGRDRYGIEYAARAVVGNVVLTNPDYSAAFEHSEQRDLIRSVFSLR